MASRRIAILGGGHGAHAHAADLGLAGHDVRLFELPAFASSIATARSMGGIELVNQVGEMRGTSAAAGGRTGFAPVGMVTTDIGQAVRGAEVILVVVPAYAQRSFMDAVIPVLEDGQMLVFEPGQFASLEFRRLLASSSSRKRVIVGETVSMLYSARLQSPGRVWIKAYKDNFSFAALPRSDTATALDGIRDFYPQFVAAHSVMETSIYRPGAVIRPISTLGLRFKRVVGTPQHGSGDLFDRRCEMIGNGCQPKERNGAHGGRVLKASVPGGTCASADSRPSTQVEQVRPWRIASPGILLWRGRCFM